MELKNLTEGNIIATALASSVIFIIKGFPSQTPGYKYENCSGINSDHTHFSNTISSPLPILILTPESGQGENPLLPLARLTVLFFAEPPEKKFDSN